MENNLFSYYSDKIYEFGMKHPVEVEALTNEELGELAYLQVKYFINNPDNSFSTYVAIRTLITYVVPLMTYGEFLSRFPSDNQDLIQRGTYFKKIGKGAKALIKSYKNDDIQLLRIIEKDLFIRHLLPTGVELVREYVIEPFLLNFRKKDVSIGECEEFHKKNKLRFLVENGEITKIEKE